MGVLVSNRMNCPVCRNIEKYEIKREKETFMQNLTTRYLENFRAFMEAAGLHLVHEDE